MTGWIQLHRKMREWEWYTDVNTCHLFMHLLLSVNHKEGKHQGQLIRPGEVKTGRVKLAAETGLSEQQIRTSLKRLESTSEITITRYNKYSVISVVNWIDYQAKGEESTSEITNNQPATNQQLTTNNNKNNKNNENKNSNVERRAVAVDQTFDEFWKEYPRKDDKQKAKTIFTKLIKKGINHEEIIKGATKYKLHCQANSTIRQYIKMPTTWLNAGSWENEYQDNNQKQEAERTDLIDWREEKKRKEALYGTL